MENSRRKQQKPKRALTRTQHKLDKRHVNKPTSPSRPPKRDQRQARKFSSLELFFIRLLVFNYLINGVRGAETTKRIAAKLTNSNNAVSHNSQQNNSPTQLPSSNPLDRVMKVNTQVDVDPTRSHSHPPVPGADKKPNGSKNKRKKKGLKKAKQFHQKMQHTTLNESLVKSKEERHEVIDEFIKYIGNLYPKLSLIRALKDVNELSKWASPLNHLFEWARKHESNPGSYNAWHAYRLVAAHGHAVALGEVAILGEELLQKSIFSTDHFRNFQLFVYNASSDVAQDLRKAASAGSMLAASHYLHGLLGDSYLTENTQHKYAEAEEVCNEIIEISKIRNNYHPDALFAKIILVEMQILGLTKAYSLDKLEESFKSLVARYQQIREDLSRLEPSINEALKIQLENIRRLISAKKTDDNTWERTLYQLLHENIISRGRKQRFSMMFVAWKRLEQPINYMIADVRHWFDQAGRLNAGREPFSVAAAKSNNKVVLEALFKSEYDPKETYLGKALIRTAIANKADDCVELIVQQSNDDPFDYIWPELKEAIYPRLNRSQIQAIMRLYIVKRMIDSGTFVDCRVIFSKLSEGKPLTNLEINTLSNFYVTLVLYTERNAQAAAKLLLKVLKASGGVLAHFISMTSKDEYDLSDHQINLTLDSDLGKRVVVYAASLERCAEQVSQIASYYVRQGDWEQAELLYKKLFLNSGAVGLEALQNLKKHYVNIHHPTAAHWTELYKTLIRGARGEVDSTQAQERFGSAQLFNSLLKAYNIESQKQQHSSRWSWRSFWSGLGLVGAWTYLYRNVFGRSSHDDMSNMCQQVKEILQSLNNFKVELEGDKISIVPTVNEHSYVVYNGAGEDRELEKNEILEELEKLFGNLYPQTNVQYNQHKIFLIGHSQLVESVEVARDQLDAKLKGLQLAAATTVTTTHTAAASAKNQQPAQSGDQQPSSTYAQVTTCTTAVSAATTTTTSAATTTATTTTTTTVTKSTARAMTPAKIEQRNKTKKPKPKPQKKVKSSLTKSERKKLERIQTQVDSDEKKLKRIDELSKKTNRTNEQEKELKALSSHLDKIEARLNKNISDLNQAISKYVKKSVDVSKFNNLLTQCEELLATLQALNTATKITHSGSDSGSGSKSDSGNKSQITLLVAGETNLILWPSAYEPKKLFHRCKTRKIRQESAMELAQHYALCVASILAEINDFIPNDLGEVDAAEYYENHEDRFLYDFNLLRYLMKLFEILQVYPDQVAADMGIPAHELENFKQFGHQLIHAGPLLLNQLIANPGENVRTIYQFAEAFWWQYGRQITDVGKLKSKHQTFIEADANETLDIEQHALRQALEVARYAEMNLKYFKTRIEMLLAQFINIFVAKNVEGAINPLEFAIELEKNAYHRSYAIAIIDCIGELWKQLLMFVAEEGEIKNLKDLKKRLKIAKQQKETGEIQRLETGIENIYNRLAAQISEAMPDFYTPKMCNLLREMNGVRNQDRHRGEIALPITSKELAGFIVFSKDVYKAMKPNKNSKKRRKKSKRKGAPSKVTVAYRPDYIPPV